MTAKELIKSKGYNVDSYVCPKGKPHDYIMTWAIMEEYAESKKLQWISVKDRMPELATDSFIPNDVMVSDGRRIGFGIYNPEENRWTYSFVGRTEQDDNSILFWALLPELPKIEKLPDCPFEFNQKVIWDSNFGYEIGYFLGEGVIYHTWMMDVKTGLIHEPCSHSKDQVKAWTEELQNELNKKYGYKR